MYILLIDKHDKKKLTSATHSLKMKCGGQFLCESLYYLIVI